jgi:hypothetical protein
MSRQDESRGDIRNCNKFKVQGNSAYVLYYNLMLKASWHGPCAMPDEFQGGEDCGYIGCKPGVSWFDSGMTGDRP